MDGVGCKSSNSSKALDQTNTAQQGHRSFEVIATERLMPSIDANAFAAADEEDAAAEDVAAAEDETAAEDDSSVKDSVAKDVAATSEEDAVADDYVDDASQQKIFLLKLLMTIMNYSVNLPTILFVLYFTINRALTLNSLERQY